jgi:general stress protein 26
VAEMTVEEAHAFLDERPGWAMLTTTDRNGYPHTIPIGYFRDGDELYMGGRDGTQKLVNVERDGRISVLVESGSSMADLKGLLIQGDGEVVRDGAELLRLSRLGAQARGLPESEWPTEVGPGRAYVRLKPVRLISWDNTKS